MEDKKSNIIAVCIIIFSIIIITAIIFGFILLNNARKRADAKTNLENTETVKKEKDFQDIQKQIDELKKTIQ